MTKLTLLLAFVTLFYPGGVALINFLKEGFNSYWLPLLAPSAFLFLVAGVLRFRKTR